MRNINLQVVYLSPIHPINTFRLQVSVDMALKDRTEIKTGRL